MSIRSLRRLPHFALMLVMGAMLAFVCLLPGTSWADGSGSAIVLPSDAGAGSAIVVTASSDGGIVTAQGSGSAAGAIAVAIGSGATATTIVVPDPTQDPEGFYESLVKLWHAGGWTVGILVIAVGLLELLAVAGKKVSQLAWISTGRVSVAIGGLTTIAIAALAVITHSAALSSLFAAAVASALAFWHQGGVQAAPAAPAAKAS